jgi:general secretion pathway protein M
MAQPTTRRDRWLALALLIAVIGVAYLLLVHPWFTQPLRAIDADIAGLQERQQRVQAQLQQRTQVAQGLARARAALQGRPGFLREATAESAAAALSTRLQDAVASASPGNRSCTISNRSPLPDTTPDARFARVALQVRLRCGIPEMAAVVHTLETGTPRLFIDNLNLLAQRFQQSPSETGTGLDVSFELVGYLDDTATDGIAQAPVAADAAGAAASAAAVAAPSMGDAMAMPAAPMDADGGEAVPDEEGAHEN